MLQHDLFEISINPDMITIKPTIKTTLASINFHETEIFSRKFASHKDISSKIALSPAAKGQFFHST